MCEHYVGFRVRADRVYFYTLGDGEFSTVEQYTLDENSWQHQLLSP